MVSMIESSSLRVALARSQVRFPHVVIVVVSVLLIIDRRLIRRKGKRLERLNGSFTHANVLPNADFDALISEGARERGGLYAERS
jgi:hypothetical protein